jgi:hypothetical protein
MFALESCVSTPGQYEAVTGMRTGATLVDGAAVEHGASAEELPPWALPLCDVAHALLHSLSDNGSVGCLCYNADDAGHNRAVDLQNVRWARPITWVSCEFVKGQVKCVTLHVRQTPIRSERNTKRSAPLCNQLRTQ